MFIGREYEIETLNKLYSNPKYYEKLESLGERLEKGVKEVAKKKGINVVVNRCGAMMTIFFTKLNEVRNYEDAKKCDTKLYASFFEHMLKNGINLPPSQFEALFLNVKQEESHIDRFIKVMEQWNIG